MAQSGPEPGPDKNHSCVCAPLRRERRWHAVEWPIVARNQQGL